MKVFDINDCPIEIKGLKHINKDKGEYYRLPLDVIETINENVTDLAKEPAGARVRFKTNSKTLYLKYKVLDGCGSMTMSGIANSFVGVYIDNEFDGIMADYCTKNEGYFEYSNIDRLDGQMHDITIYLPMHDRLEYMEVGIDDEAEIKKPNPYRYDKQIVFYGSSITQGIAASHAGNSYVDFVCRKLDSDYLNLGFSGSAFGEDNMAEYISSLDMSIFVMDYDHNAPSIEHLKNTHERFFNIIRSKKPLLPIVLLTKPNFRKWRQSDYQRRDIIKDTYLNARKNKDNNVYFVDGECYFGYDSSRYDCTIDGLHPNDIGMMKMANVIIPVLKRILDN